MTFDEAKIGAKSYPIEDYIKKITTKSKNGLYICPICGSGTGKHKTGALSIKDNKVTCFSCNDLRNSDIFDFIALVNGMVPGSRESFLLAYNELGYEVSEVESDFGSPEKEKQSVLALKDQETKKQPQKDYTKYIIACKEKVSVTSYFTGRGLGEETIDSFNLGYEPDYDRVVIPYNKANTYYVTRKIHPKDKNDRYRKPKTEEAGQEPLFNGDELYKPGRKPIFLVEGHIDALSIIELGYSCIGLGGTGTSRIKEAVEQRKPLRKIIIVPDNDEPGNKTAKQLIQLLTAADCEGLICKIDNDYKDVNEYLVADRDGLATFLQEAVEQSEIDKKYFHTYTKEDKDGNRYPKAPKDALIVDDIIDRKPMFIMGKVPYIYSNGVYLEDINGTNTKSIIRGYIFDSLINSNVVNRIYNLLLDSNRIQKRYDEINRYPNHWIPFKNGMFDVKAWKDYPHSKKYYCVNLIPHKFYPEDPEPKGEQIEKFLQFSIPDQDDREMLLQYFGYCLTRDTGQQKFMILKGNSGNGKSRLLELIENMVGKQNCCSISLQNLNQRFYATGLLNRLLNVCADIPSEAMKATDTVKKIVGQDTILGEHKGKDSFPFTSYAKLIFSANSIPLILEEKTNAFYRRLLILQMDNKPEKEDANLSSKLAKEVPYMIYLCLNALRGLYEVGKIKQSKNSIRNVEELYMNSDTVKAFIVDQLEESLGSRIERGKLYDEYERYCMNDDRQPLGKKKFYINLREKGYHDDSTHGKSYFFGLKFKETDFEEADNSRVPFT